MKRVIKLYILEHIQLFVGVFISCIAISGSLALLEHNTDYFYLGVLYLFLFLIGTGIHFHKSLPLYKSILSDVEKEEDMFLEGNSPLARAGRSHVKQVRNVYAKQLEELQQKNQNYKQVMNKWVHQMKTPLSVLNMMTQENPSIPSESMTEEINRMDYLLNQILQLIRMEKLKNDFMVECCRLSEIVKAAVNEEKSYFIQNEISPKMEIEPSIFIYTDKKWLSFVVQQLLSNAVKYSEPGQTVLIRGERKHEGIALSVQDFGIGILKEDAARIYEFCYTGNNGRKKQKESSGLGLYLVKSILDYLEHKVEMTSVPGEGTVFTIYLNTDM